MCGVFGYIGEKNCAAKEVITGLQRLEYRGYDSAGICLLNEKSEKKVIKSVGKVSSLQKKMKENALEDFHIAIGHTRWATHGGVNETNCHPHTSNSGRFVVIHNGIIENFQEIKRDLEKKWHEFYSQTDTEIAAKLFEEIFDGNHLKTLEKMQKMLHGAYGLVFLDQNFPDKIFGMKKWSPLVIGFAKNAKYVSSDYRALIGLIDHYSILEDGDIFEISRDDFSIFSEEKVANREKFQIDESEKQAELGDFSHFMLKEIFDQSAVIRDVFRGRIDFEKASLHSQTLNELSIKNIEKIIIVASGTSYHAGLMGKYYLEELADIKTEVVVSAEFKYQKKFISDETLFIFVSQSGETADALDSLKIIKKQGAKVFGMVNVPGSSIARITERGLYTRAGIEIGVASTKAFSTQVVTFLILALHCGLQKNLDYKRYRAILSALEKLPEMVEKLLENTESVQNVAKKYSSYKNFFFLGRAQELPIAMEGSLKLKEISYIHSEAYASGELKHGSIALIDENFPSVMVNGKTDLYEKNLSSVQEIRARNGKVIGVVSKNDEKKSLYDAVLEFESLHPEIDPILEVVVLQLFSYFVALDLDREIDKPRNLAKSVTVE